MLEIIPAAAHSHWYLIHCKPRQDERALDNLERQGFECFRPTRRVDKLRLGCKRETRESLFPSYLFIRLDSVMDNWSPIRSTRGVNRIVSFDGHPLPVADDLIDHIQKKMVDAAVEKPYFKPGERVVIVEGAFAHVEAIFLCNDGDERVMLLTNILSGERELAFPLTCVRKI